MLSTPLLQLHGADDGCIVAQTDDDARQFEHGELKVVEARRALSSPRGAEQDRAPHPRLAGVSLYPVEGAALVVDPFDATAGTRLINQGRITMAQSQPGRKLCARPRSALSTFVSSTIDSGRN